MHDGLALALAKCPVKRVAVVFRKVVAHERLATVLVYSLQHLQIQEQIRESVSKDKAKGLLLEEKGGMAHLISSGIAKAREEREEFCAGRCARLFLEDDRIQL